MDKECVAIHNVLSETEEPLTQFEIAKLINEKFEIKISAKIVKNYLWSFFRNDIIYDQNEYKYSFKEDRFLMEAIHVNMSRNMPRAIDTKFQGSKIKVEYDENVELDVLIKAIAILNYREKIGRIDLVKKVNRIIEQLDERD